MTYIRLFLFFVISSFASIASAYPASGNVVHYFNNYRHVGEFSSAEQACRAYVGHVGGTYSGSTGTYCYYSGGDGFPYQAIINWRSSGCLNGGVYTNGNCVCSSGYIDTGSS